MLKDCIIFGDPDIDSESCRTCWKDMPEIFYSCIKRAYHQQQPHHISEPVKAIVTTKEKANGVEFVQ